ncbi:MAG: transglutaminase domain-containing protein [Deltaproteobacteria bacterium]|nr:transglutaminase domain-containing protein [Deltaproteobacteria bacterium]
MTARSLGVVAALALLGACSRAPAPGATTAVPAIVDAGEARPASCDDASTVVTADIKAGIERHIADQAKKGGGYFALPFAKPPANAGDAPDTPRTLELKLVRVHTEYLSNLGPGRHFACVDLVDVTGDVYDVDFFLQGDPGAMNVTETTVHKLNGKPYYAWDQDESDKSWHRIPVDQAKEVHFGVKRGEDDFEFRYQAKVPELTGPARMWLPLPQDDGFQTVAVASIDAPGTRRTLEDGAHGNRVLLLELAPEDGGKTVELRFRVHRKEKAAYAAPDPGERYLRPDARVPLTDKFKETAQEVVAGKLEPLVRARALYDHVIDSMKYMKFGDGFGQGDAVRACNTKSGNCTDYHSYFIALARSVGIPARFAIGASIPSDRDEGGIDGYHCWVEFYAEGKWWPVDLSEADKYSALSTYYFGHHPANRLELSRGRDLLVEPLPASGPINFLAYPVLEVDGKPVKAEVSFSFVRTAKS